MRALKTVYVDQHIIIVQLVQQSTSKAWVMGYIAGHVKALPAAMIHRALKPRLAQPDLTGFVAADSATVIVKRDIPVKIAVVFRTGAHMDGAQGRVQPIAVVVHKTLFVAMI